MIKAKYTYREDGNGVKLPGWYVTHYAMPVGRPYETKEQAVKASIHYCRDLRQYIATLG